ncbi:kinesin-associated, partial [Rozella allomycis CSF55]
PGKIDVHPTDDAIIVNYSVETQLIDEQDMVQVQKSRQQNINVTNLKDFESDFASLALEIVEQSKLIHPSKVKEVEQLLYYLLKRKKESLMETEQLSALVSQISKTNSNSDEFINVNLENLDEYIDQLYEDLGQKVAGTKCLYFLAQTMDNLYELIVNGKWIILLKEESFMNAVTRVLLEDGRKSIDLTFNICFIISNFSLYSDFHSIIHQYKLIDLMLKTFNFEMKRGEVILREGSSKQKALQKHNKLMCGKIKNIQKLVLINFFLNVSEDISVEMSLAKDSMISRLLTLVLRENSDLQIISLIYLTKLCVFQENIKVLINDSESLCNSIESLFSSKSIEVLKISVRFLLNICHEVQIRLILSRLNILPKIIQILNYPISPEPILCLLYLLSIDDKAKSFFAFTEIVPFLMKNILECPDQKLPFELMGLSINIASNQQVAELIVQNNGLKFLIKKATKTLDNLLLKFIRNLCQHDLTKSLILDYLDELMILLVHETNQDVFIELLGILAAIDIEGMDYAKLV